MFNCDLLGELFVVQLVQRYQTW